MNKMLSRDVQKLQAVGCSSYCNLQDGSNVCSKGATLRATAGLKARKIDEADYIGERDAAIAAYQTAKRRFLLHADSGRSN